MSSTIAKSILSAAACAAIMLCGPATAQRQPTLADRVATATDPQGTALAAHYQQMEQRLMTQGRLRTDRRAGLETLDATTLASHFATIALQSEYSMSSGSMRAGGATPLRRWEQPVRLGVQFGESIPQAQQRADMAAINDIAERLQTASGHSVTVTTSNPNFHVLVVSDVERADSAPLLRQLVPGLSNNAINAITGMGRNTRCIVLAWPDPDPTRGYVNAVAVVRAEHPPRIRRACMEEELAQGMGLANDDDDVWPSIFNDDEEFGVLTRHDELLLQMLYHRSLQSGMRGGQIAPVIAQIAAQVLGSS